MQEAGRALARFFGEPDFGLHTDYIPLQDRGAPVEKLWSYLPYEAYCPETQVFLNRGATGFVLKGRPLAGATFDDQTKVDSFFRQKENLPEGASVQFLLVATPRLDFFLKQWQQARPHPSFQDLTQRRVEFLRTLAFSSTTPARDFKVFVSYTLPGPAPSPLEKEKLLLIRENLQGTLTKIGLTTEILTAETFVQEVRNLITAPTTTQDASFWYSPVEELSRQVVPHDLGGRVTADGFYCQGDAVVAHSFLPRTTPKLWALGHMDKLFGDVLKSTQSIPCPFWIHYGFTVCEGQTAQKKRAELKRELLEKAAQSTLSKWQAGVEEDFQEAQEVVAEIQRGERIIDACFHLTTFCPPAQLGRVKRAVESLWQDNGWEPESARYNHLNLFLASLPMMWTTDLVGARLKKSPKKGIGAGSSLRSLGVTRRTITKEPQNLLPVVAEWQGQVAPGLPLVGRRGQVCFWSPFDGALLPGKQLPSLTTNYNFCVAGVPGSGKSFLCNEVITTTLAVGGKAFVMDKGRSFANLALALGGHHVDFKFDHPFSLNPFTHIPEDRAPEAKEDRAALLKALLSVVQQMAFPLGGADAAKLGILKEAVYQVWERQKSQGSIDAIRQVLEHMGESRAKDIARSLIDFSSQGLYGAFFNPPANMNLSHDFVVVETDTLEEPLKSVMVMMMMVQVWQRMVRSDRKAPFLVLIDEAWDLLRGKASGDFIEALALTSRKYRCALGLATQSLTHFFNDERPGPRAAFENSAWKVIFKQEPETISGLKEHPHLKEFVKTPFREQLLRTLQKAEAYSEMVIFGQGIPGVPCRLFCDPATTLLYSTQASDVALLNDLKKQGLSLQEAIEVLLHQRGEK